jgi:acetoin utilization protein AcuB
MPARGIICPGANLAHVTNDARYWKRSMQVTKIMTPGPITVSPDDRLSNVREIFDRHQFHHVLVVEEQKLVGVVSDRDLLRALSPHLGKLAETVRDLATLSRRVHQIMTRQPIVLQNTASVEDAIETFRRNRISCIPIVDAQNRPVGIVSWRDVFKVIRSRT